MKLQICSYRFYKSKSRIILLQKLEFSKKYYKSKLKIIITFVSDIQNNILLVILNK